MSDTDKGKTIAERLVHLRAELPVGVELVAVSKFQPVESLQAAYDTGQRAFGESRVKELLEKIPLLPSDICWHFIGHLQTNKVKDLVGKTFMIQSVDSERLLALIDSESRKKGLTTDVLLQVHIAEEETKFGFSLVELEERFDADFKGRYPNVRIRGLMSMATNTDDEEKIRKEFAAVANLFNILKERGGGEDFILLSLGMSDDWPIAVEEGANLVRIGSAIFGPRV